MRLYDALWNLAAEDLKTSLENKGDRKSVQLGDFAGHPPRASELPPALLGAVHRVGRLAVDGSDD